MHQEMEPFAAFDCGTNNLRLLIARVGESEGKTQIVPLVKENSIVRLGENVDRNLFLSNSAMERTLSQAQKFATICDKYNVKERRLVATSAVRDAINGKDFLDHMQTITGAESRQVSGNDEAKLSFIGATNSMNIKEAPFLMVDIGAGATKFALGAKEPDYFFSADIGTLRLTERILHTDPVSPSEMSAIRTEIGFQIDRMTKTIPLNKVRTIVGVGRTILAVAKMTNDDISFVDPIIQEPMRVVIAANEILLATRLQRGCFGVMAPEQNDIIGAGAVIWMMVINAVIDATRNMNIPVVSTHDGLLEGLAIEMATQNDTMPKIHKS